MRSEKELAAIAAESIKVCGGQMPIVILAFEPDEIPAIEALLKRRRGAKHVSIRLADRETEGVNAIWPHQ